MFRKIILLFLTLCSSCASSPVQEDKVLASPTPKRELKKDIPDAGWVKIYFEGIEKRDNPAGLDEIVQRNGIYKLRENVLADGDFETRIWVGFGKYGNDGLILKHTSGGNWTATYLSQMLCHIGKTGKYNLEVPKSGWETIWQKLVDAGILTLPDSSKLNYKDGAVDGKSYVIETNYDYLYRTYEYANPDAQNLKEAKQMIKIGEIIADEFDLKSFSIRTGGCGDE